MTKPKSQAPGTKRHVVRSAWFGKPKIEFKTPTGTREYTGVSNASRVRVDRYMDEQARKRCRCVLWSNGGMQDWVIDYQPEEED